MSTPLDIINLELSRLTAASIQPDVVPLRDALDSSRRRSMKDLAQLLAIASQSLESIWSRSESEAPEDRLRIIVDTFVDFMTTSVIGALENEKDRGSKPFREASKCVRMLLDVIIRMNGSGSTVTAGARIPSIPFKTLEAEILFARLSDMAACMGQQDEIEIILYGDASNSSDASDGSLPASVLDDRKRIVSAWNKLRDDAPALKKLTAPAMSLWKACLDEYHESLAPIYSKVAERIRSAFFPDEVLRSTGGALQALWNLHKVKDMCKVKQFAAALAPESESALTEAVKQLEQIRRAVQDIERLSMSRLDITRGGLEEQQISSGAESSPYLIKLGQLEVLKGQIGMIHNALTGFLRHTQGIKEAENLKKKVSREVDVAMEGIFVEWQSGAESDPDAFLNAGGRVMERSKNGSIDVLFGSRLITILREVRRFQQTGFKVSSTVLKRCDKASEVFGKATQLRQVCQFYNRIADRVIPSQQALFAPAGKVFDRLFSDKKSKSGSASSFSKLTWQDTRELDEFTRIASQRAEDVESLNKTLRAAHRRTCDTVIGLFGVSFLTQNSEWRQAMRSINETINNTIKHLVSSLGKDSKGVPRVTDDDALLWRAHWDYQIAKVMTIQYRADLLTLLSSSTAGGSAIARDAAVEISPSGDCTLSPPVETLRQDLFKKISSLVSLPISFEGVGGASHVYARVVDEAHESLLVFYSQLELAVRKAAEVPLRLKSFAPIATVGFSTAAEVDAVISPEIKSIEEYRENYELLNDMKRQLARVPDFIPVTVSTDLNASACFRVSTTSFKAKFDAGLRLIHESLQRALEGIVNIDNQNLIKDLRNALERLPANPQSLSEISLAQKAAFDIRRNLESLKRRVYQIQELSHSLREFATEDTVNADEIQQLWSDLTDRLAKFAEMTEKQKATLKDQLAERTQELESIVQQFSIRWESNKPELPSSSQASLKADSIRACAAQMADFTIEFEELEGKVALVQEDCREFGVEMPTLGGYKDLREAVTQASEGWGSIETFYSELDAFSDHNWIEFRPNIFQLLDFANGWTQRVADDRMSRSPQMLLVKQIATEIAESFPAFKAASCEAFNDRHWAELKLIIGLSRLGIDSKNLKVKHLLDQVSSLHSNIDKIKELAARAVGEVVLRNAVEELHTWIEQTEFAFTEATAVDGNVIPLVKDWKELLSGVADNQAVLSSLRDSRFFAAFKDEADQLGTKLGALDENFQLLNKVQRKWVHLEPIFGRGALPSETDRFERVNQDFKKLLRDAAKNRRISLLATIPNLSSQLTSMLDQLERCQKALNTFLEEKRAAFPRFYFLGDEDLLEILGQSSNARVIQSHLKKLFAGINDVKFDTKTTRVEALVSSFGEEVPLRSPVAINGPVETWLSALAKEMQTTLSTLLQEACMDPKARADVMRWPNQIVSLAWFVQFSTDVEAALSANKLHALKEALDQQLVGLTSQPRRDALQQACLKALILDVIHRCDVTERLQKARVTKPTDWHWFRQLRYYLTTNNQKELENVPQKCEVRMMDSSQSYTFEYQGNAPRLVFTPLTDKCYLTLMQGMHLGYGGNPYGPAGTGKTESVKALGAALGRQVLVFNCDEGIDFLAMGRIFVGLVRCGAWGCFDEFNRLLEEQLSAISLQIQVIQNAIKTQAPTCQLLGNDIPLNPNAGIFVTLNPAGKGYGGRSRLPDNLKALFRPVAMSVPDNELIAEVLLLAEGFRSGKKLAKQLVTLFLLCRQLLSPQQHYDWGLRALKTVLSLAGQQLSSIIVSDGGDSITLSESDEEALLLKAAMSNTLSKLTIEDSIRMRGLVSDVFPGVLVAEISYPDLEEAVESALKKRGLEFIPEQKAKILQLHEASMQRTGIILVGPSGCGKTTTWQVLHEAYHLMGSTPFVHIMNPKSMDRRMLLGQMDPDTREWTDGVLTAAARKVSVETADSSHSWIVLDGDVDPAWVEALNTVLDDNRLLTMPHGDRISFNDRAHFLFETHDLTFASPATISRCGMLFLSDEAGQVQPLVRSWVSKRPKRVRQLMEPMFNEVFFKILNKVFTLPLAIETTKIGIVQNVLSRLPHKPSSGANDEADMGLSNEETWYSSREFFSLQLVLGFTSLLFNDQRSSIALEIFRTARVQPPNPADPLDVEGIIDTTTNDIGVFKLVRITPSADDMPTENSVSMTQFRRGRAPPPLIGNKWSHLSISFFKNALVKENPLLLVGPQGCGKSTLLRAAISQVQRDQVGSMTLATLECNAQTTSAQVIQKLKQVCASVTGTHGRTFRPREGSRIIMYVKDVNLPRPDKYNSAQVISLLQQIASHGGFYDNDLEFVHLERVQIVASATPASTLGRHSMSTRFTANVRMAAISEPDETDLSSVFSTIAKFAFNTSSATANCAGVRLAESLASSMVNLYSDVKSTFTSDQRPHFVFCPRDIQRWLQGILRYVVDNKTASELDENALCAITRLEARRVFRDRLVTDSEKNSFDSNLDRCMATCFGSASNTRIVESLAFTSLLDKDPQSGTLKGNMRSVSFDDYQSLIHQGVITLDREEKSLDVVLFPEFLALVGKIDAALSGFGSSMLLVGATGVGRRSAVSLVSHLQRAKLVSPCASREYGIREFKKDLRQWLVTAGVENQRLTVFVEDYHVVSDPAFLELLNTLLSSFEIPGLWSPEELDGVLHPIKLAFSEHPGDAKSLNDFFIQRLKQNLRMVISLNAQHPQFVSNLAANPALVSRCSIVWTTNWSRESMSIVTSARLGLPDAPKQASLTSVSASAVPGSDISKAGGEISKALMAIYEDEVKTSNAPPKMLSNLLQNFQAIYNYRSGTAQGEALSRQKGLAKLEQVQNDVAVLRQEATKQQAQLEEQEAQAKKAMDEAQKAMSRAADRRREVQDLEVVTKEEEAKTSKERDYIQKELETVEPIMIAAQKAVKGIDSKNLQELKSLAKPPQAIMDVLGAVVRLMGQTDTSWANIKKFLTGTSNIDAITHLDPKSITKDLRRDVASIIAKNASSFEPAVIKRASVAAAPLADWVRACISFAEKIEQVIPMQLKLDAASGKLYEARAKVDECKKELEQIDKQVAQLQDEFAQRKEECGRLKTGLEKAQKTLSRAQHLLTELSSESSRWYSQVKAVELAALSLSTHSALAAAFATFLGSAPENVRASKVHRWFELTNQFRSNNIQVSPFNFLNFMSTDAQRLEYKADGLPNDILSAENAGILAQPNLAVTPLLVDPSSAASNWLTRKLQTDSKKQSFSIEIALFNDTKFASTLELAVRFGKTLVCMEADSADGLIIPLLKKDLSRQGPREVVRVGDRLVDYNSSFRLFLCTRNSTAGLGISSDVIPLIQVINFSVTRAGLESQLLTATLAHELPSLEARRTSILQKEERLKIEAAECEQKLLLALADSQGSVLENEPLINTLAETKNAAQTISQALTESQYVQQTLENQRSLFVPIAEMGASLFMLLKDFSSVDRMYSFSLESFKDVYIRTLHEMGANSLVPGGSGNNNSANVSASIPVAENGDEESLIDAATAANKVRNLKSFLLQKTIHTFGRALFKKDRLTFAIHIVHGIKPGLFGENEFLALLGNAVIQSTSHLSTCPSWVPHDRREAMDRIRAAVNPNSERGWRLDNTSAWQEWINTEEVENSTFPGDVSTFQKVLIISALRPDRLETTLTKFVCDALGVTTLSPPALNLERVLTVEASANSITLFIVTPGADPSSEITDISKLHFSKETTASSNAPPGVLKAIPMGGGNQNETIHALHDAAMRGDWILLQNVHLVTGWLTSFEKEFRTISANAHPRFRCLLTSEPHSQFPTVLLESAIKITYEAPPGLKNNVERSLSGPSWTDSHLGKGSSVIRAQSMALCALFHSVIQERRAFNSQGYTKFYEFTAADLQCASETVAALVEKAAVANGVPISQVTPRQVDWQSVRGAMELAIYAPRLESDMDVRVVREYLRAFFAPEALASSGNLDIGIHNGRFNDDEEMGAVANLSKRSGARNQVGREPQLPAVTFPQSYKLNDIKDAISSQLADTDAPLPAFGLPANIDRAVQRINSQRVIEQLVIINAAVAALSVNATSSSGGSAGVGIVSVWSKQLSPIVSFWNSVISEIQSISASFYSKSASFTSETIANLSPVDSFFLSDADRALSITKKIDSSLKAISRAITHHNQQSSSGGNITIEVNAEMIRDGDALLRGEVPQSWASWKGAPERPLSFLRAIFQKTKSLHQEYLTPALSAGSSSSSSQVLTRPVKLADLLGPHIFLNALRQQTARSLRCPVDKLKLSAGLVLPQNAAGGGMKTSQQMSKIAEEIASESNGSGFAIIDGLSLEGAVFDNHRQLISGASRETQQLTTLPPLKISWVPKTAEEEELGLASDAAVHDAGSASTSSSAAAAANPGMVVAGESESEVRIPVYLNLLREDLLCLVPLTTDSRKVRVLNAAALIIDSEQ